MRLFLQWPADVSIAKPQLQPLNAPDFSNWLIQITAGMSGIVTLHADTALPHEGMASGPLGLNWSDSSTTPHLVVVAIIGSADARANADAILACVDAKRGINLCGSTSIPQLIAPPSRRARLAVGGCSGPKHLAMALGTPTLTLYGPSSPVRWGPLFDRPLHAHVESPVGFLSPREHAGLPANHAMPRLVGSVSCR